ncbi:MAG TPA: potassium channel family protein [Phycisphaerae bacterium]|nr:two pore domain potassium channel family protein [Phycisphaerales bacterium]HRX86102.1 potassium channel family protein [Phycisphaerae bacterium]
MGLIGAVCGLAMIILMMVDGFETILQPRRVTHRFRFARLFYRGTWWVWRAGALRIPAGKRRNAFLSFFGPLSLLGLFATWVVGLVLGFALLHAALGTRLHTPDATATAWSYVYFSGSTFFTLGYGDMTPLATAGRVLAVVEAGLGFGFLAVIISYLPVLSDAYSRREIAISLLDARAGSPPSAAQFLRRAAQSGDADAVESMLGEWEQWAATLLESHLSFPVLAYYRSQHDNQSWLAALTAILDVCAILLAQVQERTTYQAQLTFAMARHVAVDLTLVFKVPPCPHAAERLPEAEYAALRSVLAEAGLVIAQDADAEARLAELRGMYEPFLQALARRFLLTLPPMLREDTVDNWQTSAWVRRTPGIGQLAKLDPADEHFD